MTVRPLRDRILVKRVEEGRLVEPLAEEIRAEVDFRVEGHGVSPRRPSTRRRLRPKTRSCSASDNPARRTLSTSSAG